MKFKNKIGIVTVLYNSESVIKDFFESLSLQTYDNVILYVVDNKSPDNSVAECKKYESLLSFEVKYILNEENYGVAKGNNLGIKEALKDNCEYILLSNNDVVLRPDTIENLYEGLCKENALLAVPKIYFYKTNRFWACGGKFNKLKASTPHFGYNIEDKGQYDKNFFVDYAATCFMLIHKSVFEKVGFMDEKYFVYYDDTDFIYRVTQIQKLPLIYIHNSVMEHKESVSTGKHSDFFYRYVFRNSIYFRKKYYKAWRLFYLLELIVTYTIRMFRFRKNYDQWKIICSAINDGAKM